MDTAHLSSILPALRDAPQLPCWHASHACFPSCWEQMGSFYATRDITEGLGAWGGDPGPGIWKSSSVRAEGGGENTQACIRSSRCLCVDCSWKIITSTLVVSSPFFSVWVSQHLLPPRQTFGSCLQCEHTAHHACPEGFEMIPQVEDTLSSLLVSQWPEGSSQLPLSLFFPKLFTLDPSAFPHDF